MSNLTPSVQRLKFAKEHGYKYVGNGWFESVNTMPFLQMCRTVNSMTVHQKINLRHNFKPTCTKFEVFVSKWFYLRTKSEDIYTPEFFASPYVNSVTFSPVK